MAAPCKLPTIYGTEQDRADLEVVARAEDRSLSQTARLLLRQGIKTKMEELGLDSLVTSLRGDKRGTE